MTPKGKYTRFKPLAKAVAMLVTVFVVVSMILCVAGCRQEPEIVSYTVTFDANGGTLAGSGTQTVLGGNKAQRPIDPVHHVDGFVFTGWHTDPGCAVLYDFGREVTQDITLYAGWTPADEGGSDSTDGDTPEVDCSYPVSSIADFDFIGTLDYKFTMAGYDTNDQTSRAYVRTVEAVFVVTDSNVNTTVSKLIDEHTCSSFSAFAYLKNGGLSVIYKEKYGMDLGTCFDVAYDEEKFVITLTAKDKYIAERNAESGGTYEVFVYMLENTVATGATVTANSSYTAIKFISNNEKGEITTEVYVKR